MTDYPNWFSNDGEKNFELWLPKEFPDGKLKALQIGAYTGDASVWLASNLLKDPESTLLDVDTWEGSDEPAHHQMNWNSVEAVYDGKTREFQSSRKIIKYKATSDAFFRNNQEKYDFIYIDGDHTAYGVLKDAVNAFEVLKVGGIMAFDDYDWRGGTSPQQRPKMAIDAFLNIYRDKLIVLFCQYQCWIKRIA